MNIVYKKIDELIPYINNPRRNDEAVDKVASSIKNYGFKVPIVIDSKNEIVAGHTRYKASKKLKLKEVPCLIADDLSEQQIKAFRIADNKVGELAEWDNDLLKIELDGLDDMFTGFEESTEIEQEILNEYSNKIDPPVYDPDNIKPDLSELYDEEKFLVLKEKIESLVSDEEIKKFLLYAAHRHISFNFKKIADFYANSDKEIQDLFEDSALVIIDFEKAIEKGFIQLSEDVINEYMEQNNE